MPQPARSTWPRTPSVKALGNKVDCRRAASSSAWTPTRRCSTAGVNYVILATPPGFRPIHIEAAVAAGKNIFTEKPVAVDGPGIRKVLDAYEEAKKKGLGIVAGTQRRHQAGYLETMKQVSTTAAIGDIVGGALLLEPGHPLESGPRSRA